MGYCRTLCNTTKKNTYGKTEEIIGNWFEKTKKRNEVILATKIAGPGLSWIRDGEYQFSKENIIDAVNKSLKRLKTDFIDLYQLHWPERKTNFFGRLGYVHKDKDDDWNKFEDILRIFDVIFSMFSGGPGISTTTLPLFVYRSTLVAEEVGKGSAVSILLIIVIIFLSIILINYRNRALFEY